MGLLLLPVVMVFGALIFGADSVLMICPMAIVIMWVLWYVNRGGIAGLNIDHEEWLKQEEARKQTATGRKTWFHKDGYEARRLQEEEAAQRSIAYWSQRYASKQKEINDE